MILTTLRGGAVALLLGTVGGSTLGTATLRAQRGPGVQVSGVLRDSLSGKPLDGAIVQVADANALNAPLRTAVTDSLGRYAVTGLTPGRYLLSFQHATLDRWNVHAPVVPLTIDSGAATPARHVDLTTWSATTVRRAMCGDAGNAELPALLTGHVEDAVTRRPLTDGTVTAFWRELSINGRSLNNEQRTATTRVREDGAYALCGIPADATVSAFAALGSDSSGVVAVAIPATGAAQHDFSLAATTSRAPGVDSAITSRMGRLSGVVLTTDGRPINRARIALVGMRASALTDERGRFTVVAERAGTHTMSTTALGYFPDQRAVSAYADGGTPVEVRLELLRVVLDTIRVTGRKSFANDRRDFESRRRMGVGGFLDENDIARRPTIETTDLFYKTPGITLVTTTKGKALSMRGSYCSLPAVYIDRYRFTLVDSLEEINSYIRPTDIRALEVYSADMAPAEFSPSFTCGSVVIWTKH